MNNLDLFLYSENHPEPLIDSYYSKNVIVIPQNKDDANLLTQGNEQLIRLITAFGVLNSNYQKDLSDDTVLQLVKDVIHILDNTKNINYSAFVQYFMVHNFTYSLYKSLAYDMKIELIYDILISYCKERHDMYLSHGYTNTVLQVMCDNYSHKRNSKSAIDKVVEILKRKSMSHITNINDVKSRDDYYFLPDKGQRYLFEYMIRSLNLKMESRNIEQNKLPDIVFKHNGHYYICELKSMKEGGGGQNKQIVEVAYFIKFSENDETVHYITFMDGNYANKLFGDTSPKIVAQRNDIMSALKNNDNNYFLNTAGMEKLLAEIF